MSMDRSRYRYIIIVPGSGPLVSRLRTHGLQVLTVPLQSWRWWVTTSREHLKFFVTFPWQISSLIRWTALLRRHRPDVIHFNIQRLTEPVVAAWLLRIPSVVHFRDLPSRSGLSATLGNRVFFGIMNLADRWIANSQATADDIARFARRPIKIIHNGIDLVTFDRNAAATIPIWRNRKLVVAMIAGLNPRKNHSGFFKMAEAVAAKRDDVEFWVVGGGLPDFESSLKNLAEALGLAKRLRFTGFIDNVPALLGQIDVVAHTTEAEGFGRVFLEAMAASVPVVAISNGAAAEVIVDGEAGILVESENYTGMAKGVCSLLDDPSARKRMGNNGRRRVEEKFTLRAHCRAIGEIYDAISPEAAKEGRG